MLTNNSVIEDSTKIAATVIAAGKTYTATVVGYSKTWDMALIRLQNASGLTAVPVPSRATRPLPQPAVAFTG